MPFFIMQRDRVLQTTAGVSFGFKKGVPLHVPTHLIPEVMAAGAVPADDTPLPDTEVKNPSLPAEALDPKKRKESIIEAFKLLAERNARGDFGADGRPHPKAVSAIVGFTVESKERNAVWTEYMEDKDE